jgi:hypothetical protein
MQDCVFNGYNLADLARQCRAAGCPTNTALAELVWFLSNRAALPVSVGEEFMREAGYIPYQGFPLKRLPSQVATR